MRIKQLILALFFFWLTTVHAQKEYAFGSTGQQKLLINPALCAASPSVEVVTLCASYPYPSTWPRLFTNYTGISYGTQKLSVGFSSTYFTQNIGGEYVSRQTDLSFAYRIKIGQKITVVPSAQVSTFRTIKSYDRNDVIESDGTYSSGVLIDINKLVTIGAALYNLNQHDTRFHFSKYSPQQFYHASMLLFKDKQITLQPYAIVQQNFNYNYVEAGTYTSYKFMTLHTGARAVVSGFGRSFYARQTSWTCMAGLSATIKKIKVGYTCYASDNAGHELFLSVNLRNITQGNIRPLMLN